MNAHDIIQKSLSTEIDNPMALDLLIDAASIGELNVGDKSYLSLWIKNGYSDYKSLEYIAVPMNKLTKNNIVPLIAKGIIAQSTLIDNNFNSIKNWDGVTTYPIGHGDYGHIRSIGNTMPPAGYFPRTLGNAIRYLNRVFEPMGIQLFHPRFTEVQIGRLRAGTIQISSPQGVFAEVDYARDTAKDVIQGLVHAIAFK